MWNLLQLSENTEPPSSSIAHSFVSVVISGYFRYTPAKRERHLSMARAASARITASRSIRLAVLPVAPRQRPRHIPYKQVTGQGQQHSDQALSTLRRSRRTAGKERMIPARYIHQQTPQKQHGVDRSDHPSSGADRNR